LNYSCVSAGDFGGGVSRALREREILPSSLIETILASLVSPSFNSCFKSKLGLELISEM